MELSEQMAAMRRSLEARRVLCGSTHAHSVSFPFVLFSSRTAQCVAERMRPTRRCCQLWPLRAPQVVSSTRKEIVDDSSSDGGSSGDDSGEERGSPPAIEAAAASGAAGAAAATQQSAGVSSTGEDASSDFFRFAFEEQFGRRLHTVQIFIDGKARCPVTMGGFLSCLRHRCLRSATHIWLSARRGASKAKNMEL